MLSYTIYDIRYTIDNAWYDIVKANIQPQKEK